MRDADVTLASEDFAAIRRLEECLWISESRFDNALMDMVFAADFVEFGRSGRTYARAEMFFDPHPADVIDATIPLPEFHARHLSEDVVQVTYVSEVRYGENIERANRSSIWSRKGAGWELRFHQGTPIQT